MTGALGLAAVLVSFVSYADAQPAPSTPPSNASPSSATEDVETAQDVLPWYLPPAETPRVAPHRNGMPLLVGLDHESYSDKLTGSMNGLMVMAGVRSWLDFGVSLGTGTFKLEDTDAAGNMRTATNAGTMFALDVGLLRNYGVEVYGQGETHVFIMAPALRALGGVQSGQATNQTFPITTGKSPSVIFGSLVLEPVGLRIASCDGWIADVRPTIGSWNATRDFDPSMETVAGDNTNTITASGGGVGLELEVGWVFWK